MKNQILAVLFILSLSAPTYAVDESAADLVARGRLRLADITDMIKRQHPKEKEVFWDIASIAYHDFTGVPEVDVVVGLAGYQDNGEIYNNGKQVVEDAGAGFAYFHKEKDDWKLKQVELVRGKKYDGFEGADLMGLEKDQLVVYSSTGAEKVASVFMVQLNHLLKQVAVIVGKDFGPRVARDSNKFVMVDFRRALVKNSESFPIYYGHAYQWVNHQFVPEKDDYLVAVEKYSLAQNADPKVFQEGLTWFETYLTGHPNDFCSLANCYDLSVQLGLMDKADAYKKQLVKLGPKAELNSQYCDQWLSDKNHAYQQDYLEDLTGKSKNKVKIAGE
jgi:hypothetical protein